jgi:multiple sugar transport system permease protein
MKTKSYVNNKKKIFTGRLKKDAGAWVLLFPFAFLLIMLIFEPTLRGILWSFRKMNGYTPGAFIGLQNYKTVVNDSIFGLTMWNTVKYVFWSLLIGFWPPIICAAFLNEIKVGQGFFRFAIYFPCMIPSIASSMLWKLIYYPNTSGLLNMLLAYFGAESVAWLQDPDRVIPLIILSATWKAMGSSMLIYLAALQGNSREVYEAACVDGAGFWVRLRKIALPQISGMMVVNFIRQIIAVFQIMEQPLAMTDGGPNNASIPVGLLGYRYAFQNYQIGSSLALNVIIFLILSVLTVIYFKTQKSTSSYM